MFTQVFRVLLITALATAHPATADYQGGGNDLGKGTNSTLNGQTTSRVVNILSRGFKKCARLPPIYRYDCYGVIYHKASDILRGSPAYAEAYTALTGVEHTLRMVVRNNIDPSKKPIRRGFQTYKAIHKAAIPDTKTRTLRALQQAQTILLRAPENKQVHFSRIADAVNSNKVILRSALLPGGLLRVAWYLLHLRPA